MSDFFATLLAFILIVMTVIGMLVFRLLLIVGAVYIGLLVLRAFGVAI